MVKRWVSTDFEVHLIETDGDSDRIRLSVEHPPQGSISNLGNNPKSMSSRLQRKEWPEIQRRRYWQVRYGYRLMSHKAATVL